MRRCIIALLCFSFMFSLSACGSKVLSYEQAKSRSTDFYDANTEQFAETAKETVENQSDKNISLKGIDYIKYEALENEIFVFYDYDAQGMLGGQYWGFYYSANNTPAVWQNVSQELIPAKKEGCHYWKEADGNDFYATERIVENWFFYYYDFDGNRHMLDWT